MQKSKWITIVAYDQLTVTVLIKDKKYQYRADALDIERFKRLGRYNQGRALAHLKKTAFNVERLG